jgi:hypothetical protein
MWSKRLFIVTSLAAILPLGLAACERQPGGTGQQPDQQQQEGQKQPGQEQPGQTYGTDVPGQGQQPEGQGDQPEGAQPGATGTQQPGAAGETGTQQPGEATDMPGAGGQAQGMSATAQQIEQQLQADADLQGQIDQVTVEVDESGDQPQIVLSGSVSSQQLADRIEQLAGESAGADNVRNELTVEQQ